MDSMIRSYEGPKHFGTAGTHDLFKGLCYVQEKVDGSQISFANVDGALHIRSKGQAIPLENPGKLFAPAVGTIKDLHARGLLNPDYIYRGESIAAPRHNVLAYKRTPKGGVILYDVEVALHGDFLRPTYLELEAERLGLEAVPCLGVLENSPIYPDDNYVRRGGSILGGPREGVVFKNYEQRIFVKYVTMDFKEVAGDIQSHGPRVGKAHFEINALTEIYRTPARWNKAIQHLKEAGKLTDSVRDIGPLVKEIQADVAREEGAAIREILFQKFWPEFAKEAVRDFHVYYRQVLAGMNPMRSGEPSLTSEVLKEWAEGKKDEAAPSEQ